MLSTRPLKEVINEWPGELPPIDMPTVWRTGLDDWFHMCDTSCVVCKTDPCDYKE